MTRTIISYSDNNIEINVVKRISYTTIAWDDASEDELHESDSYYIEWHHPNSLTSSIYNQLTTQEEALTYFHKMVDAVKNGTEINNFKK